MKQYQHKITTDLGAFRVIIGKGEMSIDLEEKLRTLMFNNLDNDLDNILQSVIIKLTNE